MAWSYCEQNQCSVQIETEKCNKNSGKNSGQNSSYNQKYGGNLNNTNKSTSYNANGMGVTRTTISVVNVD